MRLSDVIDSRDNNFNAIRIVLALLVLISHSYAVVLGNARFEPLRTEYGLTFGTIAVDAFFVISGLLVTQSLLKIDDFFDFTSARLLRVWPGLALCMVWVTFIVGPAMTTLDEAAYFGSGETRSYFLRGLTLFDRGWTLPGVFKGNPYGDEVNAPLWTLIIEVRFYVALAIAWLISQIFGPRSRSASR